MYKKGIHHCFDKREPGGGIKTYVESLLSTHPIGISAHPLYSLKDIDQSQYELLHIHQRSLLWEVTGACPIVYTLHNNGAYCPSGTKFLRSSGLGCNRSMSMLGCIWGHLVDNCGSRKPQNIVENLQNAHQELAILTQFNIVAIAVSDYVRSQAIQHGLSPQQVFTVRNFILPPETEVAPLTPTIHDKNRILFVGRISPYKGLEWLLKALKLTDARIQLDIAGDGWYRPQVERTLQALNLGDRVTWHGWCSPARLNELYQHCFALIVPSVWHEPAGLVTLEAYARYRPVIASRMGGIPEYIEHDKTGLLVSSNQISELAAAITELADNYSRTRQLGEQAYAYLLERFTIEQHLNQLRQIYEQTIEKFQCN